jgi:hypothetical protein
MKRQHAAGIIDGNEVDYFVKGFVHSLDSVGFLSLPFPLILVAPSLLN